MNEKPPPDPADHAEDFSRRYARELEIASGQVVIDLGLSAYQMGARDPDRNSEHHTFFPGERSGGSISPAGQVTLDSAVMDPRALDGPYGGEAGALWRKSRAGGTGDHYWVPLIVLDQCLLRVGSTIRGLTNGRDSASRPHARLTN